MGIKRNCPLSYNTCVFQQT